MIVINGIINTSLSLPWKIAKGFSTYQACEDLLPRYVKKLPKGNQIDWILPRYKYQRVEDKKKWHYFVMALLLNRFNLQWHNINLQWLYSF